ncbi:uncharacterized protein CPUR_07010 [Claviceps purpurea 20.1]|uniref:Uncharacterized protein n=1 Tax=Claviceps purpurea (strain 20.1) TaxID=1111077 RepID=M1VXI6_CLAP2|nr:uncharacterized protein CPUR_07010 [Claviceps purpurea 20.1]
MCASATRRRTISSVLPNKHLTGTVQMLEPTTKLQATVLILLSAVKELAGVSVEDIDDIRTGKFEPWNLIRLRPTVKKTHLPSECASDPLIFVNSFSNYIYVYHRLFGREHPDVVIAQVSFLSYITEKGQSYIWTKCLDYAMKRFISVKASTIHDAEEWQEHPRAWTNCYFTANHTLPAPLVYCPEATPIQHYRGVVVFLAQRCMRGTARGGS